MSTPALTTRELLLIRGVLARHSEVKTARLFGSRAKGTNQAGSDVDLALWGELSPLQAEAIGAELDELPTPYKYDVKPFDSIRLPALREHIERVGVLVYPPGAEPGTSAGDQARS